MNQPKVGDHVKYVDECGVVRDALVTASWGSSINVVVISKDENQTDSYGRKLERETSQVHKSQQQAPGRYWIEA